MNRKSVGFSLRKSLRPRESQASSLVGPAPTSGKRAFGNRSVLDVTRNSAGGSRQSLYGQPNQKDPRVFNDEFIRETFNRIRQFLSQKAFSSDVVPNTNKLTLRQFENMFTLLFRQIEPAYNPPNGNTWMEHEVPILMESICYPHKVTKSMMQTVSSKPGPVVGILDYLLDMAAGMDCDAVEACRLLQNSEAPLQVETEELARSSFPKGQTPQVKEQVLEMASRHKGVMDEQAIIAEMERVRLAKHEAEAELQLLTEQQAERDSAEEEYLQLVEYLDQMKGRQARKKQEFDQVLAQKAEIVDKMTDIEKLVAQTKKVVENQPISIEEIRSMRNQMTELETAKDSLSSALRSSEAELEAVHSSARVAEAELDAGCAEIVQMLANAAQTDLREVDRETLTKIAKDAGEMAKLLKRVTEEYDVLAKKIAKARIAEEEQLFELDQQKTQLQTSVDYAKQDKDALQEKLCYFNARLAEKLEEILFCRRAVGNHENQLVFIQKEVDDLRVELKRQEVLLTGAETKLEQQRKEGAASLEMLSTMRNRVQSTIAVDLSRMQQTTKHYREAFSAVDCDGIVDAVLDKVNTKSLRKFMDRCLEAQKTADK